MERALLRVDGFFGDNVGSIPFGGTCVRGPSLPFWAGCGGSAFEVGSIVSPPASEKVLSKASCRERYTPEAQFPRTSAPGIALNRGNGKPPLTASSVAVTVELAEASFAFSIA